MQGDVRLVIPLLLKRRAALLPRILDQVRLLSDQFWFVVMVDEPAHPDIPAVLETFPEGTAVLSREALGLAGVLDGGDNFFARRNVLHEYIDQYSPIAPTHCALWDDDHLIARLDPVREFLRLPDCDLIYATKRFLWDSAHQENAAIPRHRSVLLWRWRYGDRYPLRADGTHLHRPDGHSGTVADIEVVDNGYIWPDERIRIFRDFARAGKIDPTTQALVNPPCLRPVYYDGLDVQPEWFL